MINAFSENEMQRKNITQTQLVSENKHCSLQRTKIHSYLSLRM